MIELPADLASELRSIVLAEVAAGNSVVQVDKLWPRPGAWCVMMKQVFVGVYEPISGVRYFEDADPHGPIAEYVHVQTGQSVLSSLFKVNR